MSQGQESGPEGKGVGTGPDRTGRERKAGPGVGGINLLKFEIHSNKTNPSPVFKISPIP